MGEEGGLKPELLARNSLGLPRVALPMAALHSSFSCPTALGSESKGRVEVVILELQQKM